MKINLILLWAIVLAVNVFAADVPASSRTVAVSDFTSDAATRNIGGKVTALVTAELASDTNLIMLDRSELNKALSEQSLGISGMVSSDAAARIGQITGAKILVSGLVFKLEENQLTIIANIIGTETARLFAVRVSGPADDVVKLASDLSSKISSTIVSQTTNFLMTPPESASLRVERIVKSVTGKKRPAISVAFFHPAGKQDPSFTANTEMGVILQKAGFPVVDGSSEKKPDFEITGIVNNDSGNNKVKGGLHNKRTVIEMKIHERRTGLIVVMDRQESFMIEASDASAMRGAQALAVDELAARFLPKLAE